MADKKQELVEYYAEWCTPSKQMHKALGPLNADYRLTRVNVDEQPSVVDELDVKALPTVILKDTDGNEIDRVVGYVTESQLIDKLGLERN